MVNRDQMKVIYINLRALEVVGTDNADFGPCPLCGTPCFADSSHRVHVCSYCGNGPFKLKPYPQEI